MRIKKSTPLVARLTLAAFAAALPGSDAWAATSERFVPTAIRPVAARLGSIDLPLSTSLSATLPFATSSPLSPQAAPPAALAAAVPARAPRAAAALKSMAASFAALVKPEVASADARSLAGLPFDAGKRTPQSVPVIAAQAAPANHLAKTSAALVSSSARIVPAASAWIRRAKPYLPTIAAAAGILVLSHMLQHFGIAFHESSYLALMGGIIAPRGGNDGGDRDVRALEQALGKDLKPGQLLTNEELGAKIVAATPQQSTDQRMGMLRILVDEGRFMALSEGRYVYTDLAERFLGDSQDAKINRAGELAKEGVRHINAASTADRALGVAALGEALKILKTLPDGAAAQIEILFKNAAYELLRDILREHISGGLDAATRAKLNEMHFGAGLADRAFDEMTAAELADRVEISKFSFDRPSRRINRGFDMLERMLLSGELPGDAGNDIERGASAFGRALRGELDPGQLLTNEELDAEIMAFAPEETAEKRADMLRALISEGLLMALPGGHCVYTALWERPSADFADAELSRAWTLSLEGVRLINGAELAENTAGLAKLGDALAILRTHDDSDETKSAAAEVKILFQNAAQVLLHNWLLWHIDTLSEDAGTVPQKLEIIQWADILENVDERRFGAGRKTPSLDKETVDALAPLVGRLRKAARKENPVLARGLAMLHAALRGKLPGDAPSRKQPAPEPTPSGDGGVHVRRADALALQAVTESSKPGQLMTEEDIVALAKKNGQSESLARHLIKIFVGSGRFMALSGGRHIYVDFDRRLFGDAPDAEIDGAVGLAKEGMRLVNGKGLNKHALGVTKLGGALEILKARDHPMVFEVEILFKNAAYELLRDVLREHIGIIGDQSSRSPQLRKEHQRTVKTFNDLNTRYFGAGLEGHAFDEATAKRLAAIVLDFHYDPEKEEDDLQIARASLMLRQILLPPAAPDGPLGPILDMKLEALAIRFPGLAITLTAMAREATLEQALLRAPSTGEKSISTMSDTEVMGWIGTAVQDIFDNQIGPALEDAERKNRVQDGDAARVAWDAAAQRYRVDKAP